MIDFPKVAKESARGATGRQRVKSIFGSLALAVGIAGAAAISTANAAVPVNASITDHSQGALVFIPAQETGDMIAYHRSHQSHYSHQSHRSHYSHYSSRY